MESKRLLLRKPSIKDTPTYHAILSCPEISRYSDLPHKPTLKRSERFVKWMSKLDARGIGAAWLICINNTTDADREVDLRKTTLTTDFRVIGAIRINKIEKKARCGVLGYELHPSYWGKGYATEALGCVLNYAHDELKLNRLEAWIIDGNDASSRVLLNNGFQCEGMQREKVSVRDSFLNIRLFARLANDDR